MRLLLSSVFGPFAVDDEYGRKENVMELFHNQVTREQGVFSLRYNHQSMGLYMMAENITAPTVVLDFPTQRQFIRELKKGFDYVGISFIVPNYVKAKRMAELVRLHSPRSKIILGGHGTSIPDIERLIDCDYVCRGEGIRFLRELLGENVDAPIQHPMLYSAINKRVLGVPLKNNSAVILPGVGCTNGCRFCCTTHYFQKKYSPFLTTGKQIFDLCEKIEKKHGIHEFFVMDENFLKHEERARELLHEMERHGKAYSFGIFSSAEAVTKVGLDFIAQLGVSFLWLGVESRQEIYDKNMGIDFPGLVKDLRDRGISVLASGILFLEHHTKETIQEDIDFLVSLNADFVQFMQLGPLPGTLLYRDYDRKNLLRKDIPFEEWHGQHKIWFTHEHFTPEESREYLKAAFVKDYEVNGPSLLRMVDTIVRGVLHSRRGATPFLTKRHQQRITFAREVYPLLDSLSLNSPTAEARALAIEVRHRFDDFFGPRQLKDTIKSFVVRQFTQVEKIRIAIDPRNTRELKALKKSYRMALYRFGDLSFAGKMEDHILHLKMAFDQSSTMMKLKLSGILDTANFRTFQSTLKKCLKEIKRDETGLVLNLSQVSVFDEHALRRLCKKMQKYHDRCRLEYSATCESTARFFERCIRDFHQITFVPIS